MKWILLLVSLISLPINATVQYSEVECILIKQQITDYQRRLGTRSTLYVRSKSSFDSHCQNPVQRKIQSPQQLPKQIMSQRTLAASAQVEPQVIHKSQVVSEPTSTIAALFKALLPILLITFFGSIALANLKKKLPQIKGRIGENIVINGLGRHLNQDEYTIINDVTLPLEDGGTTQVDHIVVSKFGVFVIETKNMSGWIFGNENQPKWTQTIHRTKHQFQNPLRQNYKHTKTLSDRLDLPHDLFHSVVIFTANAELKTQMPDNVGYLEEMMTYIKTFNEVVIDHKLKIRVLKLVNIVMLKQGRKTNKQHIEYLSEKQRGDISS